MREGNGDDALINHHSSLLIIFITRIDYVLIPSEPQAYINTAGQSPRVQLLQ